MDVIILYLLLSSSILTGSKLVCGHQPDPSYLLHDMNLYSVFSLPTRLNNVSTSTPRIQTLTPSPGGFEPDKSKFPFIRTLRKIFQKKNATETARFNYNVLPTGAVMIFNNM